MISSKQIPTGDDDDDDDDDDDRCPYYTREIFVW
jgi:hypothetical protein